MTLLLGVALLVLSVYFFFFSHRIKIKPKWYLGLAAGIMSGIMGGMFSIGGPPVVIYFIQSEEDSEHYVGTISAYFVLSGVITALAKAASGFITEAVWIALVAGIFGMIVGTFLGKRTGDRIKPEAIRKAVYGFMALSGIANIVMSLV